jgi:hypothetical protein
MAAAAQIGAAGRAGVLPADCGADRYFLSAAKADVHPTVSPMPPDVAGIFSQIRRVVKEEEAGDASSPDDPDPGPLRRHAGSSWRRKPHLNPAASAFPVACCRVSERIMSKYLPWGSEIEALLRSAPILREGGLYI